MKKFFLIAILLMILATPVLASERNKSIVLRDGSSVYSNPAYDTGRDIGQWLAKISLWFFLAMLIFFAIFIVVVRWVFRVNERTELLYEICEKLETIMPPPEE